MTWPTRRMSTANWIAERQFRSVWTTTLATLRWTNISPGSRPTIWLAGTRLSEHPIHMYCGACWRDNRSKKPGSCRVISAAHVRLFVNRLLRIRISLASGPAGERPDASPRARRPLASPSSSRHLGILPAPRRGRKRSVVPYTTAILMTHTPRPGRAVVRYSARLLRDSAVEHHRAPRPLDFVLFVP